MRFNLNEEESELLAGLMFLGIHILNAGAADYSKIQKYDAFYEKFESLCGYARDDWGRIAYHTNRLAPFIEAYDQSVLPKKES